MRPAPLDVQHRRTCRRCGDPIQWATTEATGRSVEITVDDITGTLAFTGEVRETARGPVPVVCYVRGGSGTHRPHECDWVPPEPEDYESWELDIVADPDRPDDVTPMESRS